MKLKDLWTHWFVDTETQETEPRDQDYEGRQEPPLPPEVSAEEEHTPPGEPPPLRPPTESV